MLESGRLESNICRPDWQHISELRSRSYQLKYSLLLLLLPSKERMNNVIIKKVYNGEFNENSLFISLKKSYKKQNKNM